MPSSRRFPYALSAVVSVAALSAAGCGFPGTGAAHPAATAVGKEVLLQPATARGPAPFTRSTAGSVPEATESRSRPANGAPAAAPAVHVVSGAAAGLYGGIRNTPSCDVDEQAELLAEDSARSRAFARTVGIDAVQIPGYLRALTPVVLRADARVTDHGFAAGASTSYQTVLQAGTAVMVDGRGLPRVRCASGNPLDPAEPLTGQVVDRGERWAGYDPERIVDITPSSRVLDSLVIADLVDRTWIERPCGESADDRNPTDPPMAGPGDTFFPFAPDASGAQPQAPDGADSDAAATVPGGVPTDGSGGPGDAGSGLPDFTGDVGSGLPDFTGDAGSGLPDFTGDVGSGLPDFTGDAGSGLPDFTGDVGSGLPDFTGDADSGPADLPDFTGDAEDGLPDFTDGADSGLSDDSGHPGRPEAGTADDRADERAFQDDGSREPAPYAPEESSGDAGPETSVA